MKKVRSLLFLLVLLEMAFIFYNSARTSEDSNGTSKALVRAAASAVVQNYREMPEAERERTVASANAAVRELAHSFEFGVLGFLLMLLLETYPRIRGIRFTQRKRLLAAVLFCLIYAVSDEIHQLFVAGRTCEFPDVAADTLGAFFGALPAEAGKRLRRNR